jgi:adenylate kinase family enzyme
MQRAEVEQIFEDLKDSLLFGLIKSETPIAILLGGQPAAGKSQLTLRAQENHPNQKFLIVNGDLFRAHHPQHEQLIKEPLTYSEKTQIFSTVFTEKLIQEAQKNTFNIIVEGTMRNKDVPLSTAKIFKDAGFRVEAYVIAAPETFSEIGIYNRYQNEVKLAGNGRLADIHLHNEAVKLLPYSVESLFRNDAVDRISIYSFGAQQNLKNYDFDGNKWNCYLSPADFIKQAREKQLNDKDLLAERIRIAERTLKTISKDFKNDVSKPLEELKKKLK